MIQDVGNNYRVYQTLELLHLETEIEVGQFRCHLKVGVRNHVESVAWGIENQELLGFLGELND